MMHRALHRDIVIGRHANQIGASMLYLVSAQDISLSCMAEEDEEKSEQSDNQQCRCQ